MRNTIQFTVYSKAVWRMDHLRVRNCASLKVGRKAKTVLQINRKDMKIF